MPNLVCSPVLIYYFQTYLLLPDLPSRNTFVAQKEETVVRSKKIGLHPLLILLAVALVSGLFVLSCGDDEATAVPGAGDATAAEAAVVQAAAAAEAAAVQAAAAAEAAAEAVELAQLASSRRSPPGPRAPRRQRPSRLRWPRPPKPPPPYWPSSPPVPRMSKKPHSLGGRSTVAR